MKKNWIAIIIFLVMSVGILSGCSQQTSSSGPNTVTIQDYSFSPNILTVKVGTNVTWTNKGSVTHTVISDDGIFDSGSLTSGQTFVYMFTTAGTYNYHCSIHTTMIGKIIVE